MSQRVMLRILDFIREAEADDDTKEACHRKASAFERGVVAGMIIETDRLAPRERQYVDNVRYARWYCGINA